MIYLLFTLFQEDDNDEHTGLSDLLVSKFSDDSKISDNIFSRIYFLKQAIFVDSYITCSHIHRVDSLIIRGHMQNSADLEEEKKNTQNGT